MSGNLFECKVQLPLKLTYNFVNLKPNCKSFSFYAAISRYDEIYAGRDDGPFMLVTSVVDDGMKFHYKHGNFKTTAFTECNYLYDNSGNLLSEETTQRDEEWMMYE